MSARMRALGGLAANPAAPDDVLLQLVAIGNVGVAVSLCNRPLSDTVVGALAASSDPDVRAAAIDSPSLTGVQRARVAMVGGTGRDFLALLEGPAFAADPVPGDVLEMLAGHRHPRIREAVAAYRGLPASLADRMARSPETGVRALIALRNWDVLGATARTALAKDPDRGVREYADEHIDRGSVRWVRRRLDAGSGPEWFAAWCDLDDDLADEWVRSSWGPVRAAVAANPRLDTDRVAELARDDDPTVRLAVSTRPELSEAERAAIDYQVDEDTIHEPLPWVLNAADADSAVRNAARSSHVLLRRSAAARSYVPPAELDLLVRDPDPQVRRLLCLHNNDTPGALLLEEVLNDRSRDVWMLMRRPAFPDDGLRFLADHDNPVARALVARDPQVTPELIEALSHDESPTVRRAMASHPLLPLTRIRELLEDTDGIGPAADARYEAASNPALPVGDMHALLEHCRRQ